MAPDLVERPVADALSAILGDAEVIDSDFLEGADADDEWFYLDLVEGTEVRPLLETLYGEQRKTTYTYTRSQLGETGRLVRFDPASATFTLNADHPLVRAHDDDSAAQPLLEDLVTAEALLEVYLRGQGLAAVKLVRSWNSGTSFSGVSRGIACIPWRISPPTCAARGTTRKTLKRLS